jgi:hypothetical protein
MERYRLICVPSPNATTQPAVEEMGATSQPQGHSQRRIGNLFGSIIGDIADWDPVFPGGSQIDIVVAYTGPYDYLAAA